MAYKPDYTITNELLSSIIRCEIAREIIDNSPVIPSWERKFQNEAIVRTVHHSTAIEGNRLTYDIAEKIVKKQDLSEIYKVRDVREIINYREAIGKISDYKTLDITISQINEIHKILSKEILPGRYSGLFRKVNAVILNSKTNEVVFDPTPANFIDDEMDELVSWINRNVSKINPLIIAGVAHYELVRIHPYVDLNGRTARILTTLVLYKLGFEINKFFSLEEYYDQNLKAYYDALDSANNGDLTEWLEYFVEGVAVELGLVKEKIIKISKERNLRSKVGQIALNDRQLILIDFIEKNGSIVNQDFSYVLPKVSDDTILRDLTTLIQKGILIKKGKTKASQYIMA